MAGRNRTVDTGKTVGRRRQRQHLPAGAAEQHTREKAHRGARARVDQRIGRTRDPLAQLDAARDYVRSAASKYRPTELSTAIQALLDAGDQIYRTGQPRSRR